MSGKQRIEFPGATYHVMSRGVDRTPTFWDDADRWHFLELVEKQVSEGALLVHAFCLMLNQFHLLAETPMGGLGKSMHQISGPYAARFNYRHQRCGYLWQDRYKAILVEDGEYFLECSRYIHLNPRSVDRRSLEEYRWSSYRNYIGGTPVVDWVATDRTMGWFKDADDYRRFVEAEEGKRMVSPFRRASAGIAWGSEKFVAGLRSLVAEPAQVEASGLGRSRQGEAPTVEAIQDAVARIFDGYSRCQTTRMLAYALRRHTSLRSNEIAAITGRTPGAVTHTVKAISGRLKQDLRLGQLYGGLVAELEEAMKGDGVGP